MPAEARRHPRLALALTLVLAASPFSTAEVPLETLLAEHRYEEALASLLVRTEEWALEVKNNDSPAARLDWARSLLSLGMVEDRRVRLVAVGGDEGKPALTDERTPENVRGAFETLAANLAGLPGMSVPAGLVDGRPVGLQLIGRHFQEAQLLNVAHRFQQATDWHRQAPEAVTAGAD